MDHGHPNSGPVRRVIVSADAPRAIGAYSQGILVGTMLFTSGQIPLRPETGELVSDSIEDQTRQVLDNLGAVLKAAGMGYKDVVSVTVFLADMDNFARFNQVYADYFREQPPARCVAAVARLPRDAGIEVSLIAIKA
jgi:2-iminobutanoate/2-iminopropanoate deaminase